MNLIISLLGSNHKKLFKERFFYNNKEEKNTFLLNQIIKRFNFCNKIFIISEKQKINNKMINFNRKNKVKIVYSKPTKNQIQSILKVNEFIGNNEKIIILNPDSNFNINISSFKNNYDGLIFNIKKEDVRRNFNKKDIFYSNSKNQLVRIKKKANYPFTQKVSAGIYYLKKWQYFIKFSRSIKNLDRKNLQVADVFSKITKKKNIYLKEVKNFICFENNKKVEEYKFWKNYFFNNYKLKDNLKKMDIQNIIPSAGEGSRHKHLRYNLPKPLIPISNKMMFEKSLESLPNKDHHLFIFRKNTFLKNNLKKKFLKKTKKSKFFLISKKTKGMAITISKARKFVQLEKPVIVSSCDLKCVINYSKFYKIIKRTDPSAMIFTWSQYPFASESPNSHAYVKDKNLIVNKISEKKKISTNPDKDSAVTGIFYFRTGKDLLDCIDYSINNKITVNGEYYIATAMTKLLNDKKRIINFKVDQLISWSLPEHLSDYLFWEKIFNNETS